MSTSTDGSIGYGVVFDDSHEFPWDCDQYDGDIEEWWLGVNGFKASVVVYDENGKGGYINGCRPDQELIDIYHEERSRFFEDHPLPIELLNYCSDDYPVYALVVPGTVITAGRGYPVRFDIEDLVVNDTAVEAFLKFCSDYGIELPRKMGWLLTSYWG